MDPAELFPRQVYREFEGGAVFTAERNGFFYVVIDEETMRDFLSEELEGWELVKVLEFTTDPERAKYLWFTPISTDGSVKAFR